MSAIVWPVGMFRGWETSHTVYPSWTNGRTNRVSIARPIQLDASASHSMERGPSPSRA